MKIARALGFCGVVVLCSLPTVVQASKDVDLKRPIARDGTISIKNIAGSVRVLGWDKDEMTITGTIDSGVETVELGGEPDHARVRVVLKNDVDHGIAELTVHVPSKARIEIETTSAYIDASELAGVLDARSVSGHIVAASGLREADVRSVSGDVKLGGIRELTSVRSVSGGIEVSAVNGQVDVHSVSGRVRVSAESATRAELKSVSGDVDFRGSINGDGNIEIQSHSGNVAMAIPASASGAFELSSFSGQIESDFAHELQTSHHSPGSKTHFSVGSGGPHVIVKSFSGNVTVKRE